MNVAKKLTKVETEQDEYVNVSSEVRDCEIQLANMEGVEPSLITVSTEPDHPRSAYWYYSQRSEQYLFALKCAMEENLGSRVIIIDAPVKSGKKEIAFAAAAIDKGDLSVKHLYLTSFVRKENKEEQHDQYPKYEMDVLYCNTQKAVETSLKKIKKLKSKYDKIVIHYDESDHGTGNKGCASRFFDKVDVEKDESIYVRYYSATNEEILHSRFAEMSISKTLVFQPHWSYRGAEWFLDQGLVHQSKPFYDSNDDTLTQQGFELMNELISSPDKIYGVVRLTGKDKNSKDTNFNMFRNNVDLRRHYSTQGVNCIFVDQSYNLNWRTDIQCYTDAALYSIRNGTPQKYLIVLNQKCSRSTEIFMHKHIAWWHDHRNISTAYNTYQQAILRVCHYDVNGFRIKVYCDPEVIKLAARKITASAFTNLTGRSLSGRIGYKTIKTKFGTLEVYDKKEDIPEQHRPKFGRGKNVSAHSIKSNKHVDLADGLLKGAVLGGLGVAYVDGKNENFADSYEKLMNERPHWEGRYIVFVPEGTEISKIHTTKSTSIFGQPEIQ